MKAKWCKICAVTQRTRHNVGSALIPREELEGEMEALKASGDGNCLFNSASSLIEGGESANHGLRLLTAGYEPPILCPPSEIDGCQSTLELL